MHPTRPQILPAVLKTLDILLMFMALAISLLHRDLSPEQLISVWDFLQFKLTMSNLLLLLLLTITWHLIFLSMGLYEISRLERGQEEWKDIVKAVLIGGMLLLLVTVVFHRGNVNRDTVLVFTGFACLFTCVGRALMRTILGWLHQRNRSVCRLLLVGSDQGAYDFAYHILSKPQFGYRLVGYLDDPPYGQSYQKLHVLLKHLGPLKNFDMVMDREHIDEVVISLPIHSCYERIKLLIDVCEIQGVRVHLLLDFFQLKLARAHATEFNGMPILTLATGTMAVWPAALKRAFDLVVSIALGLLLAPLLLLIALLLKLTSPHDPVLFVQTRVGYNRRHFKMFKFRTMVPDAEQLQADLEALNEAHGPVFKIKHDPRITPLGYWLRRTSLDEIPQLFNVIKGDMSLVGPRPLPLRDVQKFEEAWLKRRFSVKPGITCLWQINGRSETTFDKWIEQDLAYIDQWSFGLDLKILAKTVPTVLKGTGAH
jgi:exopolysaccharide biosynthesis polyprenyl glycosylphosphotransferase